MRLDTFPKYNITAESLSGASTLSVSLPLEGEGYVPVYCGNDGKLSLKFADITEFANNNSGSSTGGDGSITVDQTFNSASTNAQSGTAVLEALQQLNPDYGNNNHSLSLGLLSHSDSDNCCAIGYNAECGGFQCVSIGSNTITDSTSIAIGYQAKSPITGGISIGYIASAKNSISIGGETESNNGSISIGRDTESNNCGIAIGDNCIAVRL